MMIIKISYIYIFFVYNYISESEHKYEYFNNLSLINLEKLTEYF